MWLAKVTSAFHSSYPGIQVQICGGYSTELLQKLTRHQVDLCLISQREGAHKRKEAEAELGKIEGELKQKLMELHQ